MVKESEWFHLLKGLGRQVFFSQLLIGVVMDEIIRIAGQDNGI
jgi:hypothetical protein